METKILRVVRQGEAFSVQSSKQESGSIQKCNIVLRELGGSKFENEYVCAMLGNLAACRFYEDVPRDTGNGDSESKIKTRPPLNLPGGRLSILPLGGDGRGSS